MWFCFNWSYLFCFWCLSSLSFKSQLFSPWRLCWKGDSILVCSVSLATFGHLYVNLSLMVTLTAGKGNDLQSSLGLLLPLPQALPTWAVVLYPGLLLSTLVWTAPWNNLCLNTCCSGISETSWPGTISEHAEAPFYLEEQAMGDTDLLKDIHCSFSLIPVSPFKVKMTWQDKVMAWRAVWGLWGHLFCRPGINSLHMCCCSTICLYSMCRFRRNVQQAEEMDLSSAGRDSSPAELT